MLSVIIPTYNEENHIGKIISYVRAQPEAEKIDEILVVDGGSTDNTVQEIQKLNCKLLISPQKGRAAQMNYAAKTASVPVLYFLHADSFPPPDFISLIGKQLEKGADAGCFHLKFDHRHRFINTVALLTRLNTQFIRFGDQSLFIRKTLFEKIGGFGESHIVMEDHEIIRRIKKHGRFALINQPIITSARKFLENGPYKLMFIYLYIYTLYYLKYPQKTLLSQYRKLISNGKL